MSSPDATNEPTLLAKDYFIDQICDAFDEAWQQGQPPNLEDYLNQAPENVRPQLLRELLLLDLEYRSAREEAWSPEDYKNRFPAFSQIIEDAFDQQVPATVIKGASVRRLQAGKEARSRSTFHSVSVPRRFGDYELLQELGRGGMGVVYKAWDTKLNRMVALKMVLAGGFASQELVTRFHGEAEAVGNLDHPGVVPVYERGQCEGHHFFVMGYVDGRNLAEECRDGPMAPRQAAQLVKSIAECVGYAHQRGIIHRDLKPANILLNEVGQPRITDFGLAKRLHHDESLTATGQPLGTPSYMAPEQAAGKTNIGPAVDVYGLGAILYYLLTARPPFQAADMMETLRQVQERDPVSPRSLNPAIDNDLDIICLKCLDKVPTKRYATAQELVEDLDRYFAGESIRARKAGRMEKSWRWAKRNPQLATVSALLLLILFAAAIGGPLLAISYRQLAVQEQKSATKAKLAQKKAEKAEEEANKARKQANREAQRANLEAATAHEVSQFLAGLFEDTDPLAISGRTFGVLPKANPDAMEILDRGVKKLAAKATLKEQPLARAALLDKIGTAYLSLGQIEKSEPLLKEALDLRDKHLPPEHLDLVASRQSLGFLYMVRGEHEKAERFLLEAAKLQEKLLGEDDPAVADTLFQLGVVYLRAYRNQEAEPVLRRALALRQQHFGEDSREVGMTYVALAQMYFNKGEKLKAVPYVLKVVKIADKISGKNVSGLATQYMQAQMYDALGQTKQAEEAYKQSIALGEKVVGADHYLVGWLRKQYSYFLFDRKRLKEAEEMLKKVESIFRQQFGDASLEVGGVLLQLARCARDQATTPAKSHMPSERRQLWLRAEKYIRAAIAIDRKLPVKRLDDYATHLLVLGHLLAYKSPPEYMEAKVALQESLQLRRQVIGPGRKDSMQPFMLLLTVLLMQQQEREVCEVVREQLSLTDDIEWPTGSQYTLLQAAKAMVREGQCDLAVRTLQQAAAAGLQRALIVKNLKDFHPLENRKDFKMLMETLSDEAKK